MRDILIINDLHLGTNRASGTTPQSAQALRHYLHLQMDAVLGQNLDKDLLILGDLFNDFTIDSDTLLKTYLSLSQWLDVSGKVLHLVPGNHDWSSRGDKLSSFHLLSSLLKSQYPDQVQVFEPEFATIRDGLYVIPHCANSDLFELELAKALNAKPGYLLLHANIMNPFTHADHSLNVSEEWARKLCAKHHIICAHEHQRRSITLTETGIKQSSEFNARADITVLGNQFPSSVSDCLSHGAAQKDGRKFAHAISPDNVISLVETWSHESEHGYRQIDWTELTDIPDDVKFVRVAGSAESSQAAEVITTIAKLRSKSQAFVITNAVSIAGVAGMDDLVENNLTEIKSFNVLEALLDLMEPIERRTIQEVMAK